LPRGSAFTIENSGFHGEHVQGSTPCDRQRGTPTTRGTPHPDRKLDERTKELDDRNKELRDRRTEFSDRNGELVDRNGELGDRRRGHGDGKGGHGGGEWWSNGFGRSA